MHLLGLAVLALGLTAVAPVHAKDPSRSKTIDFEDEVVEALNKRPLDSLSQISEAERRRRRQHLYRKRASFKDETTESVRELRYVQ